MAFTFINKAEYDSASSSSAVVNKPTNTAAGDIMFAFCARTLSGGYCSSVPTGWVGYQDTTNTFPTELFYKLAGASEPASYTFGYGSATNTRVTIVTYRGGFDKTSLINTYSNTSYNGGDNIIRAASMTTTKANCPLVFFAVINRTTSRTFTKPSAPTSDWVEDSDAGSTNSDKWQEICSMVWASSGATGDMDAIEAEGIDAQKHAFAIALNPEVLGPANLKSYNTNLKANIKSINTNLIANVKSLNTNV